MASFHRATELYYSAHHIAIITRGARGRPRV